MGAFVASGFWASFKTKFTYYLSSIAMHDYEIYLVKMIL